MLGFFISTLSVFLLTISFKFRGFISRQYEIVSSGKSRGDEWNFFNVNLIFYQIWSISYWFFHFSFFPLFKDFIASNSVSLLLSFIQTWYSSEFSLSPHLIVLNIFISNKLNWFQLLRIKLWDRVVIKSILICRSIVQVFNFNFISVLFDYEKIGIESNSFHLLAYLKYFSICSGLMMMLVMERFAPLHRKWNWNLMMIYRDTRESRASRLEIWGNWKIIIYFLKDVSQSRPIPSNVCARHNFFRIYFTFTSSQWHWIEWLNSTLLSKSSGHD